MDFISGWAVLAAALLFWAVGAYNRLIRLRAQAIAAFHGLASALGDSLQLITTHLGHPVTAGSARDQHRADLLDAGGEVAARLKSMRSTPLDGEKMAALGQAYAQLLAGWEQLGALQIHLPDPDLASALEANWLSLGAQVQLGRVEFNRRVESYNCAIRQFPAVLLAMALGLQPARIL
jgi:LemA protein